MSLSEAVEKCHAFIQGNIISFGFDMIKTIKPVFGERHSLGNHILSSVQNYSQLVEDLRQKGLESSYQRGETCGAFLTPSYASYFHW